MSFPQKTDFVLTAAGLADVDLAIAASRAGAAGILNAELSADAAWIAPMLARLARFGGRAIGLKIADAGLLHLAAPYDGRLGYLVVDPPIMRDAAASVARIRAAGAAIVVEVTEWSAEIAACCAAADAIWLKGHEAGGWVGEQTSFILLQKIAGRTDLPFYVRGGVNERSAAAASIGGAAGVVLDDQLLLLRESPLATDLAPRLRRFTGVETILVEQYGAGPSLRIWPVPGRQEARALAARARQAGGHVSPEDAAELGWAVGKVPPMGQDGAVAIAWAARYGSVAAALRGIAHSVATLPALAANADLCGPDTAFAQSHGTLYPIVQGPMTHVSDRVDFIAAVAEAGALPMVAVSLMRGEALKKLLRDTGERLGDRPWGVGMLGFVPADVAREQRDAVRATKPSWAIIAGGRPDQSRDLEAAGIATYLHVPSPALLAQFLDQGARHFIFEGRECGGHIGPLSSFVLWGQMVDALVDSALPDAEKQKIHVLFAGGIHDARSSAMAAVMAAPLAARKIRSGILMGTAYTFTAEAVTGTAITAEYQRIVVAATETVGLVTGPGHASRCAVTPFVQKFWDRSRALEKSDVPAEDIRQELDDLSLGRLRLASKGLIRERADRSDLRSAPVAEQRDGGMYMIGQVCVLRDAPTTAAALHREVGEGAVAYLRAAAGLAETAEPRQTPPPADIAIVGMSAVFPGAADLRGYWENILAKRCTITEIPADRWSWELYYDADRNAPDKIYSKWGGFIPDVTFDPTHFGMPPVSVRAIDPMQLLALTAVEAALDDAGMAKLPAGARENTSVIIGTTGGLGELGMQYGARAEIARGIGTASAGALAFLPEWTSDSFAGVLPNVTAGRIANRFDFGGVNFTVDAACAASLAALRQAVMELETGRSDVAVCGGVDTVQGPFGFTCFSKAQALSPTGRLRTFDAAADGTTISEGVAMVVLKRLADAERDGDRIYGVIKGMGGSSDGRHRGLMAPLPAGQKRALARAYAQAGYSPATVELFEAHGTGTVAGDAAELESLSDFLRDHGARPLQAAVGSVKTMIGHTKATAGIAGLIKMVLGLHHRVLPPHMGVEQPNAALLAADSPLGLHQQMRPWLARQGAPRRAGVSSFGFGGTNFHVALEEYRGDYRRAALPAPCEVFPAELYVWRAADRAKLVAAAAPVLAALEAGAVPPAPALARALAAALGTGRATLAIVAASLAELGQRLAVAVAQLGHGETTGKLPVGVYFSDTPLAACGKLAMLFSGQGSQYPDMLREASVVFDELRDALEEADAILGDTPTYQAKPDARVSQLIYPHDRFGAAAEQAARAALASTDVAQPALGAVETGLLALAERLGLRADMAGGHSYGEYVALHAAGVLSRRDLLLASEARGRFIIGATQNGDLGVMAAVAADEPTVRAAIGDCDVVLANFNAPQQTVISGTRAAIAAAVAVLGRAGLRATMLPVAAAFHSPLMRPAQEPLATFLSGLTFAAPKIPVYANATAAPHDADPDAVRALLARHLTDPVKFLGMIEAMYESGARIFLEIGPKSVLADLARRILGNRPCRAVSLDGTGGGLTGMLHGLAALMVEGVAMDLGRLFAGRATTLIDLANLAADNFTKKIGPNDWLVNGTRARRPGDPFQTEAPREKPSEKIPLPAPTAQLVPPSEIIVPKPAATRRPAAPRRRGANHVKDITMDGIYVTGPDGHDGPGGDDPDPDLPATYAPATGADRTMAEYYQTMRQFLAVQERLMMAYLGGADSARPYAPIAMAPRPALVARAPEPAWRPAPSPVAQAPAPKPAAPVAVSSPAPAVPVPTAVAPAPAMAAAAAPVADPRTMLLQIASDRTGYPQDMLGLDLNMEADLGIDSIKRIEILGAFRMMLPATSGEALSARMDDLTKARSLQGILDVVGTAGGAPRPFDFAGTGEAAPAAPPSRQDVPTAAPSGTPLARPPLARYVIRPWAEALPAGRPAMVAAGIYVIVPDALGIAGALQKRLELDGARVRVMPATAQADEDALGRWLAIVRAEDRIRGVIDLRPARPAGPADWTDFPAWQDGMEHDVKALFPVLRLTAGDLSAGGHVLVASTMGGFFGRDALVDANRKTMFPGAGGGVGLIKCLSFEWPDCHCKAVDLDLAEPVETLADHLHAELAFPGGRREAGYPAGIRTICRTEPASLIPRTEPEAQPDPDWVVLAIGGARGITAETLRPFAAARVTCVIVGRSPPPGPEDAATLALADVQALRGHFLAQARKTGEMPKPAEIEARIGAVLRDREIRQNLADFTAAGAKLDIRICNVRQEAETAALMQSVYERHGRIDAVLFGAGLIEDTLLVNKTPASLARVFDTKTDGAFFIARALKPKTLKFFALFTSVAGRYGNRGQTDYGAANEVLNRFAWVLQARWGSSVKVSAINWGPWARTTNGPGMLTPETARQFTERGVNLIEPDEGSGFLFRELLYAPRDAVEVVAGEHPWEYLEAAAASGSALAELPAAMPLLPDGVSPGNGRVRKIRKTIDLVSDPYLDDHRLDGKPVLPLACATEYMAEAATLLGGAPVRALTGVRMLNGLVLRDRPLDIELTLQPSPGQPSSGQPSPGQATAAMEFFVTQPKLRLAYRATAEFGANPTPTPHLTPVGAGDELDVDTAYRNWLFHGPRFQTLKKITSLGRERIVAQATATRPEDFYPPARGKTWIFDPGLIDGALQLIFAWSRKYRDAACLPTALGRIARHGDAPLAGNLTFFVQIQAGWTDSLIKWRFDAVDENGRIRLSVDDGEVWIDPQLNRLSGGWAGGVPALAES